MALRDDLLANRGIDWSGQMAQEQRSRILVSEPSDRHLREPGEDVITDTRSCGTDERDSLGEEAASNEAENLLRCLVEPVRVVDDAHERLLLGNLRKERQGRESNQESVRSWACTESEHGRKGVSLRLRESLQLLEHRGADLVKAAVSEFQLGLDTGGSRDTPAIELLREVVEQGAFADAGLATENQDTAPTVKNVGE
jgi:hypothetical protein